MRSKLLRAIAIGCGAAILGALIGSTFLFAYLSVRGGGYPMSPLGLPLLFAISLPFTLFGSLFLSALHKWPLRRFSSSIKGVTLIVFGPLMGIAFLQAFFKFLQLIGAPPFQQAIVSLIGAGFGAATALSWILIRHSTRRRLELTLDF